jgi:hypothetical protein
MILASSSLTTSSTFAAVILIRSHPKAREPPRRSLLRSLLLLAPDSFSLPLGLGLRCGSEVASNLSPGTRSEVQVASHHCLDGQTVVHEVDEMLAVRCALLCGSFGGFGKSAVFGSALTSAISRQAFSSSVESSEALTSITP